MKLLHILQFYLKPGGIKLLTIADNSFTSGERSLLPIANNGIVAISTFNVLL